MASLMTKGDVKKHVTLRISDSEMLEIMQLRSHLERDFKKPISLQAAMRTALLADANAVLNAKKHNGKRSVRVDLLANHEIQAALKSLQGVNQSMTMADIVLSCTRILIAK